MIDKRGRKVLNQAIIFAIFMISAHFQSESSRNEGHNAQKTYFSGNLYALSKALYPHPKHSTGGIITVKQKRTALITLPRLGIEELWYGSPYIELTGTSYILSSSGWLSMINRSSTKARATFTQVAHL